MFLELWTSLSRKPFYFKSSTIDKLLEHVKVPNELPRTYRSLTKYSSDWKASEFRNFLLIYSAPVLKTVLSEKFYKHWLLLVNFMRMLTKKVITDEDLNVCRKLAFRFTRLITELYGPKYVRATNCFIVLFICCNILLILLKFGGAPWASSSFLYESVGWLLGKFFKGSNRISKQMFSIF